MEIVKNSQKFAKFATKEIPIFLFVLLAKLLQKKTEILTNLNSGLYLRESHLYTLYLFTFKYVLIFQ
jgi:hypothetical protein